MADVHSSQLKRITNWCKIRVCPFTDLCCTGYRSLFSMAQISNGYLCSCSVYVLLYQWRCTVSFPFLTPCYMAFSFDLRSDRGAMKTDCKPPQSSGNPMLSTSLLVAPNEQLTLKRRRKIAKAEGSKLGDLPFQHTRKMTIANLF